MNSVHQWQEEQWPKVPDYHYQSVESKKVKKMPSAVIRGLSPSKKAELADMLVRAKTRPGLPEMEAMAHLFSNLRESDYVTNIDRACTNALIHLIKNDKSLMNVGWDGTWHKKMRDEDRVELMQSLAKHHATAFGLTYPFLWVRDYCNKDFPYPGFFDPEKTPELIHMDTRDDGDSFRWIGSYKMTFRLILHEATHRYQNKVLIPLHTKNINTPRAAQASLLTSNMKCPFSYGYWGSKVYEYQPRERHAWFVAERCWDIVNIGINRNMVGL